MVYSGSFIIFYGISSGLPTQNDTSDDLVDEKGDHEHIQNFASNADIVVCCLSMNSQTVRLLSFSFAFSMHLLLYGVENFIWYTLTLWDTFYFQAGIVNKTFLSSMKKVCSLLASNLPQMLNFFH